MEVAFTGEPYEIQSNNVGLTSCFGHGIAAISASDRHSENNGVFRGGILESQNRWNPLLAAQR